MSDSLPPAQQFIAFRIADKILMSPLSLIEEVSDPLPVTAIGGTHSWFQGLASKQGRLLPVSDLGDYAIHQPSRYESAAKWLIVSRDNETIGLIVDEVIGLSEPARDGGAANGNNQLADALQDTPLGPLVTGVLKMDTANAVASEDGQNNGQDQYAAVVDLGQLLTQQQFIQVEASV